MNQNRLFAVGIVFSLAFVPFAEAQSPGQQNFGQAQTQAQRPGQMQGQTQGQMQGQMQTQAQGQAQPQPQAQSSTVGQSQAQRPISSQPMAPSQSQAQPINPGSAVESQLKAAVSDTQTKLGTLEPWQRTLFFEEVLPQYQRFIRDYRASDHGLTVDVDLPAGQHRYLLRLGPAPS